MALWPVPVEEDPLLCPGTDRAVRALYSAVAVRADGKDSKDGADAVAVRLNVSSRAVDDSGWLQPAAALVWTAATVVL